jgi:hypothetical protein
MDITVTRVAGHPKTWNLTDLLGRPMGRITQARGPGFIIEPAERASRIMGRVPLGPHASLEDALRAIEKQTQGACHCAPDQT